MASPNSDPFLMVQSDVLKALSTAQPLFASYRRIRALASSPTNPELTSARSELETTLGELDGDLADLAESVAAVEHDPYRYGIELDELSRRRQLVADVARELENIRTELQRGDAEGVGGGKGTNVSGLPNPGDFDDQDGREDYYAEFEEQRQRELFQDQEQQLDGVFNTVGNLRQQANVMGRELGEQTEIAQDIDTRADRLGGKIASGTRRVTEVIRRNEDTLSSGCIGILIIVLIILLVLVIAL